MKGKSAKKRKNKKMHTKRRKKKVKIIGGGDQGDLAELKVLLVDLKGQVADMEERIIEKEKMIVERGKQQAYIKTRVDEAGVQVRREREGKERYEDIAKIKQEDILAMERKFIHDSLEKCRGGNSTDCFCLENINKKYYCVMRNTINRGRGVQQGRDNPNNYYKYGTRELATTWKDVIIGDIEQSMDLNFLLTVIEKLSKHLKNHPLLVFVINIKHLKSSYAVSSDWNDLMIEILKQIIYIYSRKLGISHEYLTGYGGYLNTHYDQQFAERLLRIKTKSGYCYSKNPLEKNQTDPCTTRIVPSTTAAVMTGITEGLSSIMGIKSKLESVDDVREIEAGLCSGKEGDTDQCEYSIHGNDGDILNFYKELLLCKRYDIIIENDFLKNHFDSYIDPSRRAQTEPEPETDLEPEPETDLESEPDDSLFLSATAEEPQDPDLEPEPETDLESEPDDSLFLSATA